MVTYLDDQDRELVCPEHHRVVDEIKWGPLVNGLPNTWTWLRFMCGCVRYPEGSS